jgi:5-formyltetrahydrofolate cyclo-ligase
MGIPNEEAKSALRREIRARLARLSAGQRTTLSAATCALLERQRSWQAAQTILFYAPVPGELDIWPLVAKALRAGQIVALPRFDAETGFYVACRVKDPASELTLGEFGIREPGHECSELATNQLDFLLVPGLAFDLHGGRLGRGKGYFDRLLTAVRGTTCGVAFDEQIVREVPVESHDVHVNCILTPTRWIQL